MSSITIYVKTGIEMIEMKELIDKDLKIKYIYMNELGRLKSKLVLDTEEHTSEFQVLTIETI